MIQSVDFYTQNIRTYINLIEEAHQSPLDEAVFDTIKNIVTNPRAAWAGRGQAAGASDLKNVVNQNFQWLGKLMGQTGINYKTLNFGNMRSFFKAEKNGIKLNDSEVNQIFDKVKQEFKLNDTKDDTPLDSQDVGKSQKIARSLLNHGIILGRTKKFGMDPQSNQQTTASGATPTASAASTTPTAGAAAMLNNLTPKQQRYIVQAIQKALGP